MNELLVVENLCKDFTKKSIFQSKSHTVTAADNVSFSLNQDEILKRVFELYEFCCDYSKKKNKKVLFEIGTEEQSGTTTSDYDLEYTLDQMKNFCNFFSSIDSF